MPRKKKSKKKTCSIDVQEEQYKGAPHSFVFHRGHVGRNVKQLTQDTRTLMEPFTAKNLQVRKKNVLKDFVSVAGLLHVSHFVIFTKTDVGVYMRLCRLPRGPTLTFKVHEYALTKDVISSLKRPNLEAMQFQHHPLLVMNNFSGEEKHIKLMATMFQNLFPSINVHKVKLNDVKRCVMVNYNEDDDSIDFRHYNIRVVPVGMSRSVKKIVQSKVPNLAKYGDISEYVDRAGYSSESEVELDGPATEVILPQHIRSRGNIKSAKSAVRLTELGPRFKLQLVKIEEGICDGQVMYHAFVNKTEAELANLKAMREQKRKVKEARRKEQQSNIEKKKHDREENKQKSLAGIKRKLAEESGDLDAEKPELSGSDHEDNDVEYYKQEVGQMPDTDSFIPGANRKRKLPPKSQTVAKKGKFDKSNTKPGQSRKDNNNNKSDRGKNSKLDKQDNKLRDGEKIPKRINQTPQQKLMERKKKKKKMKEKKKMKKKGGNKR